MLIRQIASIDRREVRDALAIAFFKDQQDLPDLGPLTRLCLGPIRANDFTGKQGEVATVWGSEPEERRCLLLGLGPKEACTLESIRRSFGALAKACMKHKCKSLNIVVPSAEQLPPESVVKALLEGLLLANYSFDKWKNRETEEDLTVLLEEITLIGPDLHLMAKVADRALKVMTAVWRARDLVNGNADEVNPAYLATFAKEIGQEFGRVKTEVKDKAWLEKEKMGLILAVARGAAVDPTFILCSYHGHPTSSDHTVLVGKGVTYDTGGLTLKPSESMVHMRCDMSGAAISLATIEAIAALQLPINVTAVVPAVENAISALSYKLGDVYTSRAGITVEVTNTDAEGRLILADALCLAVDVLKPTRIIDIGTLTGAMEVALGNELMGLFSNSDSLAEELFKAGQRTYERSWRMPLYEEYKSELKSDVADIKNAATRRAGSILCAIFLQRFIKDIPWAHFDIAPVAFAKEAREYLPKNATGIGVRMLVDYFEHLVQTQG